MGNIRERRARRARTTAAGLLAMVLVATVGACGSDDDTGTGIPQSGNVPTTAPAEDGGATGDSDAAAAVPSIDDDPRAILDARPYAVGQRTATLVDASRGTQAVPAQGIAERPDRTIELIVLYPAEGDATGGNAAPVADAPVAEGRFPLLVFAHGWTGKGEEMVPTAQRWASAGYVIALPTFPLSRDGIGFSEDLPQQPGDVRFVLDTVLGYADDADDPLAGHVDPEHVAVGGHSLGAATALAFLNSCCDDPRVDAVIAASGGPVCCEGGEYPESVPVPLLLVHGGRDTVVGHAASDQMFGAFGGDVSYLFLAENDHLSYFRGDDHELFDRTVVAFLDAKLGLDPGAPNGLADDVAASGRGTFRTK